MTLHKTALRKSRYCPTLVGLIYRIASKAFSPFAPRYLRKRLRLGKEDSSRLQEREGFATLAAPQGALLWIHGASVGETLSVLPLIHALLEKYKGLNILVTSGTVTSAGLLHKRLPAGVIHQYIPLDVPLYAQRFLDYWRPDAVLWLESELWPNLLAEVKKRSISAALINARLSPRAAKRWRWAKRYVRAILSTFDIVLAQSESDATRLRGLAPSIPIILAGNLKFTAPALMGEPNALCELLAVVGVRPRWVMASTHAGEELIAVRVHRILKQRWPDLLTIIVPRHPSRAAEILPEMSDVAVIQRSQGLLPAPNTDIYLADTLGELGTLYSASPIACVGGSFIPKGGHNPIEPAQCGCAVISGGDMSNFTDVAAQMAADGALVTVNTPEELAQEVSNLLSQPNYLLRRQEAARQTTLQQEHILHSVLAALEPVLAPLREG